MSGVLLKDILVYKNQSLGGAQPSAKGLLIASSSSSFIVHSSPVCFKEERMDPSDAAMIVHVFEGSGVAKSVVLVSELDGSLSSLGI